MAGALRGEPGGIVELLDLIGEHEPSFTYDWRTRFGVPLEALFTGGMSWTEALLLTQQLLADPSTRVCAAVSGWPEPWPREAFILADLFDLTHSAHAQRRPKPYPRPMDQPRRHKSALPAVSQAAVRAALAARGHTPERMARAAKPLRRGPHHPEWDAMDHLLALEEGRQES